MKFKSKYNVGDIVYYFHPENNRSQVGKILGIFISYSATFGEKIEYDVRRIKVHNHYVENEVRIVDCYIYKKIHKKAFEKEYAKECAREIAQGEEK